MPTDAAVAAASGKNRILPLFYRYFYAMCIENYVH